MMFITREDGERFVVPSYRDVITAKNAGVLKKEINILTKNYGAYITLQRKGPIQYEIAFSQETGYLLGETVWHQLKRPLELIYCEAIPNTTDVILVVVKGGSVYLDGTFPADSIPEELIVFLTQQNNFDIYTYGDVPISQTPEVGKFSFESSSVRSFTLLDKPLIPTLPLLRIFQLQFVDQVLKANGIGVFPAKKAAIAGVILFVLMFMWTHMTSTKQTVTDIITSQVNPYATYVEALTSPAPDEVVASFLQEYQKLLAMPGWNVTTAYYAGGVLTAKVQSGGSNLQTLQDWVNANNFTLQLDPSGVSVIVKIPERARPAPTKIYSMNNILTNFLDQLAQVYVGNHVKLSTGKKNTSTVFTKLTMTITLEALSPSTIALIGEQMAGLPFILKEISLKKDQELLDGSITFDILGS